MATGVVPQKRSTCGHWIDMTTRVGARRRGFIQHQRDLDDDGAPAGPAACLQAVLVFAAYIRRQVSVTVKGSVPGVVIVQPPIELIDRQAMHMQFVMAVVMEQHSACHAGAQNEKRQQRHDTQQCAETLARPVRFRASSEHCPNCDPSSSPVKPKHPELRSR